MQSQQNIPTPDDLMVDTTTGELMAEDHTFNYDDLPRIARVLRGIQKRQSDLVQYRDAEMERVEAITNHSIDKLAETVAYLEGKAQAMMETRGQRRAAYPSLGAFAFRKGAERVDTSAYDQMDDKQKRELQSFDPALFKKKTTVTPDKTIIKQCLKGGDIEVSKAFVLVIADETFTFKAED